MGSRVNAPYGAAYKAIWGGGVPTKPGARTLERITNKKEFSFSDVNTFEPAVFQNQSSENNVRKKLLATLQQNENSWRPKPPNDANYFPYLNINLFV